MTKPAGAGSHSGLQSDEPPAPKAQTARLTPRSLPPEKEASNGFLIWLCLTRQTALSTEAFVAGHYEDHGSIDGRLQTVTERGAMRFVVYESLSDKGINCFLGPDQADEAIRNWRKRVEVYGVITYRRDGTPVSIRVEDIVPFSEPEDIPDFRSVRGILRQPKGDSQVENNKLEREKEP